MSASPSLRVVSYNVHSCVGMDFRRSETRIADVLAELQPDIVGLQELDSGRRRSAGVDQARVIAERLGFQYFFYPAIRRGDEHYGDAILSRWPLRVRRAGELPSEKAVIFRETRGALWVEIAAPDGPWHVLNTHFGLGRAERCEQAAALLGDEWLGAIPPEEPLLLLGDLNSFPRSRACRLLRTRLQDASLLTGAKKPAPTFPVPFPFFTLDYIFVNAQVTVHSLDVCRTAAARRASDHFPVLAVASRKSIQSNVPAQT